MVEINSTYILSLILISLVGTYLFMATRPSKMHRILFIILIFMFLAESWLIPGSVRTYFHLARWAILAMFVLYFGVHVVLTRRVTFHWDPYTVNLLIIWCLTFASAMWSQSPMITVLKSATVLAMFFNAAVGIRGSVMQSENGIKNLAGMYMVLGFLIIGGTAALRIVNPGNTYLAGLFRGFFQNSNKLGIALVMIAPFLYLRYQNPWGRKRNYMALGLLGTSFLIILMTVSRSSIGAFMLIAGIIMLVYNWRLFPIYLLLLVGAFFYLQFSGAFDEGTDLTDSFIKKYIYKDRRDIMDKVRMERTNIAVENIKKQPIFGVGFGISEEQKGTSLDDAMETGVLKAREKGSSYLAVTEEMGAVGMALLAILLIRFLFTGFSTLFAAMRHLPRDDPDFKIFVSLFAGVVALTAHASFENWMFSGGNFIGIVYWSTLLVVVSQADKVREKIRAVAEEKLNAGAPEPVVAFQNQR